ncbi:MAG: transposase [Pseudobdellovibrio sp.]
MPRSKRLLQPIHPYHVTLRAHNRLNFNIDMSHLWDFCCDQLLFSTHAFKIEIHAFVLMKNHYHLLVRTPESNISQFMRYFNQEFGREIRSSSKDINLQFGSRFYSSVIDTKKYYDCAYKYVYRNPVEARFCKFVQEYPYSSIQFLDGGGRYRFPLCDYYFNSPSDIYPNLTWLNTKFEEEIYWQLKKSFQNQHSRMKEAGTKRV